MPFSLKSVVDEDVRPEHVQKWDLLHPSKRKEPLCATMPPSPCLLSDFVLLGPASLCLLPPQTLSPSFNHLPCSSHVTQSLPLLKHSHPMPRSPSSPVRLTANVSLDYAWAEGAPAVSQFSPHGGEWQRGVFFDPPNELMN